MSKARRVTALADVEPFVWDGARTPQAVAGRGRAAVAQVHTLNGPLAPPATATQLAEIEREAFAKGFAQGERAGQEAANQRAEAMVRRLTDTLQELTQLRTQMIHQTERQMVELALAVARRVVHREVSLDPDLLVAMARVALERLGEAGQIVVRLNPEDHQLAGASRVAQIAGSTVKVVPDGRIARGGCRVESEVGMLDAGIDSQIQEIAQALLGREETVGAPVLG